MAKVKEQWSTRLGVILAVSGSAVGIGNFLRFPGNVAENGGGAFMIPYFCALIFLAVPICWAEWAMGKYAGQRGFNSYPAIFGLIGRRRLWRNLGGCLGYAWSYLTGAIDLGTEPSRYAEASARFTRTLSGMSRTGPCSPARYTRA